MEFSDRIQKEHKMENNLLKKIIKMAGATILVGALAYETHLCHEEFGYDEITKKGCPGMILKYYDGKKEVIDLETSFSGLDTNNDGEYEVLYDHTNKISTQESYYPASEVDRLKPLVKHLEDTRKCIEGK